jgi:hypothetical protein
MATVQASEHYSYNSINFLCNSSRKLIHSKTTLFRIQFGCYLYLCQMFLISAKKQFHPQLSLHATPFLSSITATVSEEYSVHGELGPQLRDLSTRKLGIIFMAIALLVQILHLSFIQLLLGYRRYNYLAS